MLTFMNRKVLLAVPVLALAACSQDDLLEVNRSVNEITFDVVSGNASKAANVFCNNNKPTEFKVWARNGGNDLMVGDHIVYTAAGEWVNETATRFWPESGNVDFYAHVNAGDAFLWNSGAPTIKDFTVPTTVSAQTDLLYSVKKDVAKSNSAVALNFHHALSQIVFSAKNTNKHLHAEVHGVELCMLSDKGTYTYPSESTEANNADHTGSGTVNGGKGTWDYGTTHASKYGVSFSPAVDVPEGEGAVVSLTSANEGGKEFNSQALMLIPQKTTKWDNSADPTNSTNGSYILVNCVIRNIADTSVAKESDVVLWGNGSGTSAEPKKIAIPADFNWEEGKKYVYTLVFGEGGGTTPPDGGDPTPSPVLVPITFDVTVDDFVNAGNTDAPAGF